ncbi:hypothetical protein GJ496_000488 [Pomphorhynchus laevis]|nr:hypothetical protein GJ496_000488 [Pomphorhynchus laevis]
MRTLGGPINGLRTLGHHTDDLSATNILSDSLPENAATLCKLYLNSNSLWDYVRFTCKYNPEYEIYLSGNHIRNVKAVRMFYATRVLDISHNLLETLLGSDCQDISQTKILNLSNNPLKNIQRYDIGVNAQLRKLILANSELPEIYVNISSTFNLHLIDLRENRRTRRVHVITKSICQYRFSKSEINSNSNAKLRSIIKCLKPHTIPTFHCYKSNTSRALIHIPPKDQ